MTLKNNGEIEKFLSITDNGSNLGLEIKDLAKAAYIVQSPSSLSLFISPDKTNVFISKDMLQTFCTKYCTGPKAIKDDIYYKINFKKNNYKFITLERDLTKSPRNVIRAKPKKIYKPTYEEEIKKDPEFIANYYSKKYSISNKDNIITVMTEDDVMCLDCGCISDERLTVVPNRDIHLTNMKCPRCGSTTSSLVTFNKHYHKLSTFYRDSE